MLEEQVETHKAGKALDTRWFAEDKTQEEKDKTKQIILNSTLVTRLLKRILTEMFNEHSFKTKDLDTNNLELRFIYKEGYKKALQDIYKILP